MTHNRNEVLAKVSEIIAETLSVSRSDIREDTLIAEDLQASSMDIVTLAISFDDEFKVELDIADLPAEMVTVKWVVDYICARLP